jgi:hypothetical protein
MGSSVSESLSEPGEFPFFFPRIYTHGSLPSFVRALRRYVTVLVELHTTYDG